MKLFGRAIIPTLTNSNDGARPAPEPTVAPLSLMPALGTNVVSDPKPGRSAPMKPAEKLQRQLEKLRKRPSLVVAMAKMAAKREAREAAMATFREAIRLHDRASGNGAKTVTDADAEVKQIDLEINEARQALRLEREALLPGFSATVAEYRSKAAAQILTAIQAIETAQEIERVAAHFAVTTGFEFKAGLLYRDLAFLKAEAITLAGQS